ncbi:rod-binding protein [Desulfurobacterium thermolithotrophum]|uniref:rod-binding protein n=1 Tax=Desulfurobacterium thermolithotrophum TaxID=64160 RepID=UPI0013CFE311|nr:rod-binding protein [Desulfurobacterium thermolithotrophum]
MIGKIDKTYWDIANIKQIKNESEAIKEFEAYFVRIFLKEARKSIPKGLFNTSFSANFYYDMLDMELAEVISQKDPLHLEKFFQEALSKYQKISKG